MEPVRSRPSPISAGSRASSAISGWRRYQSLDLQSLAEMADDLAAHRAFPTALSRASSPQGRHEDLQASRKVSARNHRGPVSERASSSRSATAPRADTGSSSTTCAKPVKATCSGVKKPSAAGGGGLRAT